MAHRGRRRRSGSAAVPKELRPIVGGVVLVVTLRTIDMLWRRVTGRPTPLEAADTAGSAAAEPSVARDRLVYATLLSGALRLARRTGLPKDARADAREGRNGKSPA